MKLKYSILYTISLLIYLNSFAQDRTFAWTYNTTVLAKGNKDLEAWGTFGTGRKYFYQGLDTRLELEVGLTDHLQTAFYINGSHRSFGANMDTLGGIADTTVNGVFNESAFSVSSEWKWKLSDPVANRLGFTLYGELTLGAGWMELEHKFIFEKVIGKEVFALNLIGEHEFGSDVKKGKGEMKYEAMEGELAFGYMHMFKTGCGLGMEMRDVNEFAEGKNWENSALMGGPTYFHSGEKYFLIFSVMPQWRNLKKTEDTPDNLVLNEHEKISVRLLLGFGL